MKTIKFVEKVKNPLIKSCPCSVGCLSCNYVVISQILNCPYNCTYCYLHSFYGKDDIVVVKDENKILSEVKEYMQKAYRPLRIGTGEYSDSLALKEAHSLSIKLIDLFSKQDQHLLELKTKSLNIEPFLSLGHKGKTVMAWSVNPEVVARIEEFDSPSPLERIVAAKKCVAAGYPVAFHFDPIIYFDNWANEYGQFIDYLFSQIPAEKIAWISLGTLRFPLKQKQIIKEKFSHSKLNLDVMMQGDDNKLRYPEELRFKLYQYIYQKIRHLIKEVYVYLCMELPRMWQKLEIKNSFNPNFYYFVR